MAKTVHSESQDMRYDDFQKYFGSEDPAKKKQSDPVPSKQKEDISGQTSPVKLNPPPQGAAYHPICLKPPQRCYASGGSRGACQLTCEESYAPAYECLEIIDGKIEPPVEFKNRDKGRKPKKIKKGSQTVEITQWHCLPVRPLCTFELLDFSTTINQKDGSCDIVKKSSKAKAPAELTSVCEFRQWLPLTHKDGYYCPPPKIR
ncbi:MAG: hypothetical protein HY747_09675 [Elusimicrobia bacterium]|nr:hypothetical protein [Elusimicrobiota bacterium]